MIRAAFALLFVTLLIATGEMFSRYGLGLGNPPLIAIDPQVEYVFQPSRTYYRFGNLIKYNSVSMRSEEPPAKDKEAVLRVLVAGDSVVNGGVLTDQHDLATETLSRRLGPDAWVGQASAGSWGPANLLAYFRRHGFFEADVLILVLSTHDLTDLPEFRSDYGRDFPQSTPPSALMEAIMRYGPRYISALGVFTRPPGEPSRRYGDDERISLGRRAVTELLDLIKAHVESVYVVLHPTTSELGSPETQERAELRSLVEEANTMVIDLRASSTWRKSFYRDGIHLNRTGQAVYATLFECLVLQRADKTGAQSCQSDRFD